jgi:hypothetical protein
MAAPVGNQFARKAKIWEQALKRALARYSGETVDAGLDRLADRMVKAAMETDDHSAAALIAEKIGDRMDGKPAQAIVGDDDYAPVRVEKIERTVVHAPNPDS